MSRGARLTVLTVTLAALCGAARAAELPVAEAPLLVVVETGPGAGCDGAAVRGAIAAELKARVSAPTAPPVVALASQRSEILLVAVDRERIVITLRGRGDRELTRSIAAPAERAAKLRAVAWLAGNIARDQLQTLALPDAVPADPSAPIVPPGDAPPATAPRAATEPAPVAPPVVVTPASSGVVVRRQTPLLPPGAPRWTFSLGAGTAVLFQGPTVETTRDFGWGMAAQLEAQRHLGGAYFVGAALDAGPRPAHPLGAAVIGGVEHRSNDLFVAASLGLGAQVFRTSTTWMSAGPPGGQDITRTTFDAQPAAYARVAVAVGFVLMPAVDLVAEMSGHLAAVQRRDAGYALATLGARFKLR